MVGAGARVRWCRILRRCSRRWLDRAGVAFRVVEVCFGAVGALVEVEGDFAGAGRVDQAREGGDVGDFCADGRPRRSRLVTSPGLAFLTVVVSFSSEHADGPALFVFGRSPLYSATQTYFPAAFGVKLALYSPSPFTSTSWGFFSLPLFDFAFSPQTGSSLR